MESHKFSVSTLYKCNDNGPFTFISSDISGEVLFHQIDEVFKRYTQKYYEQNMFPFCFSLQLTEPFKTIKMPLPFKSKIAVTTDLEHILSPGLDGILDVFQ